MLFPLFYILWGLILFLVTRYSNFLPQFMTYCIYMFIWILLSSPTRIYVLWINTLFCSLLDSWGLRSSHCLCNRYLINICRVIEWMEVFFLKCFIIVGFLLNVYLWLCWLLIEQWFSLREGQAMWPEACECWWFSEN